MVQSISNVDRTWFHQVIEDTTDSIFIPFFSSAIQEALTETPQTEPIRHLLMSRSYLDTTVQTKGIGLSV